VRPFLIRRRASPIETLGRWLALAVGISALTAAVNSQVAIEFPTATIDPWLDDYESWREAFFQTAPIVLVMAVVPAWLPRPRRVRWPLLAAAVVAAVALGWLGLDTWVSVDCGCEPLPWPHARGRLFWLFVVAVMLAVLGEYRQGRLRAAESLHQIEVDRLRLQSELVSGRLQLLQAQIEPHFLFNSLANVRRLLRTDGPAGRAMLADLLRYLETALPRLREDAPTLDREIEGVRAFLGVHQVRMGPRLQVDIDVPTDLRQRVVPPMMLLTLVENALKHGLQPLLEGGSIRIDASSDPTTLRVQVADTGRGLGAGTSLGAGTGLANIRARLRAMHGSAARLSLRVNEPRGVIAMIELPLPS
jgi:hypothetical protein